MNRSEHKVEPLKFSDKCGGGGAGKSRSCLDFPGASDYIFIGRGFPRNQRMLIAMPRNQGSVPAHCDVCVMGGGPAGSNVASLLAQKGFSVVLLEKGHHPRYQVGESLLPHFWKFADQIGVADAIQAEGFLGKGGAITVWDGKIHQFRFADFGFKRPALHVERDRFDLILFKHASDSGAYAYEGITVQNVDFEGGTPVVHFKDGRDPQGSAHALECSYVVDATGTAALLARQFGTRKLVEADTRYVALWGYYDDARFFSIDGKSHGFEEVGSAQPATFISSYEHGWSWHITLRDRTSVGLVSTVEQLKRRTRAEQEQYFRDTCGSVPFLKDLLADATLSDPRIRFMPDYSYYSENLCGDGFYCVGDAGAFADPIFSHGLQATFYGASLCAWALESALNDPARKERYAKICDAKLRQYYDFSRALALGASGSEGTEPELVKSLLESMSPQDLEMTLVASVISNRSDNFRKMAADAGLLERFGGGYFTDKATFLSDLHI